MPGLRRRFSGIATLEPFANHPLRSPCRIVLRSFPKCLRLLLKNLRLFLLPGVLLHLDKICGGGVLSYCI